MKNKGIVLIIMVAVLVLITATYMVYAQPGTESDPVVTLSYINDVLREEMKFKVVEVPEGKILYGEAGSEMILRMGKGTIVATQKGGIADLTSGFDLSDGAQIPANHHLVVPVDDGRGLKLSANALVMVKGGYSIK